MVLGGTPKTSLKRSEKERGWYPSSMAIVFISFSELVNLQRAKQSLFFTRKLRSVIPDISLNPRDSQPGERPAILDRRSRLKISMGISVISV